MMTTGFSMLSPTSSSERATTASGFSKVSFPLTPAAEEAIKALDSGVHNWVQLTLDSPPTHIDVVTTKTVPPSELSSALDSCNPQFYLYHTDGNAVLIYCCPDQVSSEGFSQTIKSRMVYSSCKASCAEAIKALGVPNVKKFDVRYPSELTESALAAHLRTKVASLFTGSELKGSSNVPLRGNYQSRTGLSQVNSSTKQKQTKPGSLASLMVTNKPLPKGVVLPPSGAYC